MWPCGPRRRPCPPCAPVEELREGRAQHLRHDPLLHIHHHGACAQARNRPRAVAQANFGGGGAARVHVAEEGGHGFVERARAALERRLQRKHSWRQRLVRAARLNRLRRPIDRSVERGERATAARLAATLRSTARSAVKGLAIGWQQSAAVRHSRVRAGRDPRSDSRSGCHTAPPEP
jgi:hypothetical protein